MKAMILAAGKGTRVQPITKVIPKPMIPIINEPVMGMILSHLKRHGVDEVVVNVSHLGDAIERYFSDGAHYGVPMAYSWEGYFEHEEWVAKAVGSAGGMRLIQDRTGFFDRTFVVLCGDAVIDVDFTEALAYHRSRNAVATIILKDVPKEDVVHYGVVVTSDDGQVQSFQEKPQPEEARSTKVNTGIYIFEPEIFDYIPSDREYDIGSELFPALVAAGAPFYAVELPFQWIDIGKTPDLWTVTRLALEGKINHFDMPGRRIASNVWVGANVRIHPDASIEGPVYIGGSSIVEAGATIKGPTLIQSNCIIEAGAEISESMVWSHTHVSGSATLHQKIIFGPHCISRDGSCVNLSEGDYGWLIRDTRSNASSYESPVNMSMFDVDVLDD